MRQQLECSLWRPVGQIPTQTYRHSSSSCYTCCIISYHENHHFVIESQAYQLRPIVAEVVAAGAELAL